MQHPVEVYRAKSKLSQSELAARLKCTQAAISYIEAGKRKVSSDMATRLKKESSKFFTPEILWQMMSTPKYGIQKNISL